MKKLILTITATTTTKSQSSVMNVYAFFKYRSFGDF